MIQSILNRLSQVGLASSSYHIVRNTNITYHKISGPKVPNTGNWWLNVESAGVSYKTKYKLTQKNSCLITTCGLLLMCGGDCVCVPTVFWCSKDIPGQSVFSTANDRVEVKLVCAVGLHKTCCQVGDTHLPVLILPILVLIF